MTDDHLPKRLGRRALKTGRVAAAAARLATRRVLKRDEGETDARLGEDIARELDDMKGLAMKVGQIMSYFDGMLPEETHAALRKLQQGGRPVAFATTRGVVEEAFARPLEELFDAFDEVPIASASIGQVHRAVFEGREVAVKVQYPSVRETFAGDFARLRGFSRLASLGTAVSGPVLVDELARTIALECDYLREAAWQACFGEVLDDPPRVFVPAVARERTRETVLTTAFVHGRDLYAFVDEAPQAARDEAARTLARVAHRSLFVLCAIQADPHPGNYLFPSDDAGIALLDFGCVRTFELDFIERERAVVRAVLNDDRAAFRRAVLDTGIVADERRFDFEVHWQMSRHLWAPYLSARFHFTPDWIRAGMAFNKPGNPNLRRLRIPPLWIWTQRLLWGTHAVLARLAAQGDFRATLTDALDDDARPLTLSGAFAG